MHTVSATEAKTRLGEFLDLSRDEPIAIQRGGKDAAVLISNDEYERLVAIEDAWWGERARQAEENGLLSSSATEQRLTKLMKSKGARKR
ncbi:hypothetical protein BH09SUM1_BH09SUM1_06750 [soil metagenome]